MLAGLFMRIGLARWSTLQWSLAEQWAIDPSSHDAITHAFDLANLVLGNATDVTNNLLPVVMIWLGLAWAWTGRASRPAITTEDAILRAR